VALEFGGDAQVADTRGDPGKGETSWFREHLPTLLVGVLSVLATLGAVQLTRQQAENAEAKKAIGASRVLAEYLRRGEDMMGNSIWDCRYRIDDVPPALAPEDLVLLAWRLEPTEWKTVGRALQALDVQMGRSKVKHVFVRYDVKQIRIVISEIDKGRHALEGVAGVEPYPAKKVKEERARGARCGKANI
jgi:hypothetical protein